LKLKYDANCFHVVTFCFQVQLRRCTKEAIKEKLMYAIKSGSGFDLS